MGGFGFNPYGALAMIGGSAIGAGLGQLTGGPEGAKQGFYDGGGDSIVSLGDFFDQEALSSGEIDKPWEIFNIFDLSGGKGQGGQPSAYGHTPATGEGFGTLLSLFGGGGGGFGGGYGDLLGGAGKGILGGLGAGGGGGGLTSSPADWDALGITPSTGSSAATVPTGGGGDTFSQFAKILTQLPAGQGGGAGPALAEAQEAERQRLEDERRAEEVRRITQSLTRPRGGAPTPFDHRTVI